MRIEGIAKPRHLYIPTARQLYIPTARQGYYISQRLDRAQAKRCSALLYEPSPELRQRRHGNTSASTTPLHLFVTTPPHLFLLPYILYALAGTVFIYALGCRNMFYTLVPASLCPHTHWGEGLRFSAYFPLIRFDC